MLSPQEEFRKHLESLAGSLMFLAERTDSGTLGVGTASMVEMYVGPVYAKAVEAGTPVKDPAYSAVLQLLFVASDTICDASADSDIGPFRAFYHLLDYMLDRIDEADAEADAQQGAEVAHV